MDKEERSPNVGDMEETEHEGMSVEEWIRLMNSEDRLHNYEKNRKKDQ